MAKLQALLRARGVAMGIGTVWRFFERHGISFKKTAHVAEQEWPDVVARRWTWYGRQADLGPRWLVFIDETGTSTKMARLRRRSKRAHHSVARAWASAKAMSYGFEYQLFSCRKRPACSRRVSVSSSWAWPKVRYITPEVKSRYWLPSTSLMVEPCPLSKTMSGA